MPIPVVLSMYNAESIGEGCGEKCKALAKRQVLSSGVVGVPMTMHGQTVNLDEQRRD
jgi:hypothetical protein